MGNLEIKIYSYNKDEVGKLSVVDGGIKLELTSYGPLALPAAAVRSATSLRIGKVAQSIYALRVFLTLQEAFRVRQLMKELRLELPDGKQLKGSAISNTTGEYVEFFVDPVDVLGYDQREKPKVRQIIDTINGVGK